MRHLDSRPGRLLLLVAAVTLAGCDTVSDQVDRVMVAWTTSALPDAEDAVERASLLRDVEPLPMLQRTYADPRSASAEPPTSLRSTVQRFLPGWEMDREPPAFRLIEGQRFRFDLPVYAGVCYGVAAFSDEIQRLDVDILAREERWAQDFRNDAWPVATFCAPVSRLLTVEVRAMHGAGEGRVMVLREPMSWRAFAPGDALQREGHDPLETRLHRLLAEVAPRGVPQGPALSVDLEHRNITRMELPVPTPGCHVVLVAGLPPIESLALRLQDSQGTSAEDRQRSSVASAMLCSERAGSLTVEIAPVRGEGVARLMLVRLPPDAATATP